MSDDTPVDAAMVAVIKEKRDKAALELDDIPNKRRALDARESELKRIISDAAAAARLFGVDLETHDDLDKIFGATMRRSTDSKMPTIREIVLEWLRNAGESGAKAADIRKHIEGTYGTVLHDKTVGMTLWRLAQDQLVRREGHTWFFVPPEAETENPGGGSPGSEVELD